MSWNCLVAALVSIGLAACAAATEPACQDVPGNALASVNCDFATHASDWTPDDYTRVAWQESHGDPEPGALQATSGEIRRLSARGACFPVRPSTSYRLQAHFRLASETSGSCSISISEFSDEACAQDEDFLGGAMVSILIDRWETTSESVETGSGAQFAKLQVECVGDAGLSIQLDNLVLRPE